MQNYDQVKVPELALPKGGGAIHGLDQTVQAAGMTGMASVSLPLPVSAGRGFAPSLTLSYSSGSGNGLFGLGWSLSLPVIARRTAEGAPAYTPADVFVGPGGEELVPEVDAQAQIKTTEVNQYAGQLLPTSYQVVRFFSRIEGSFDRIERWTPSGSDDACFWLIHGADGSLHLYGKTAAARIADPQAPNVRIVRWLLEESLSPTGEHIHYVYRSEDAQGLEEKDKVRDYTANRYLDRVCYGNKAWRPALYLWNADTVLDDGWHFVVVFDYGQRSAELDDSLLTVHTDQPWQRRQDPFSDYAAGFEVRTHRLCRQVLLFHAFDELGTAPVLVKRMRLAYQESPFISTLTSVHHFGLPAQDPSSESLLPPIAFDYAAFQFHAATFRPFSFPTDFNDGRHYQLVDLYGEGVPGVLYKDATGWLYRSPQREPAADKQHPDAMIYGPWQALPSLPTGHRSDNPFHLLMDLTGNGHLDWVIARAGIAGFFTQHPDKTWSDFTPFAAFPPEFFHAHAQLTSLVRGGLSDLVLIGPKSVRLYANKREHGFAPPQEVAHTVSDDTLPLMGISENEVVAFSDMLGSGQQHLVRIRRDSVQCWPNVGRGCFGAPITLASNWFTEKEFNARHVFLADLDGSGATDLLYVQTDRLLIWRNQAGNSFSATPLILLFPKEIRYDQLCHLSFADIDGLGCTSLVITVPHPTPTHWRYDFSQGRKPYLLRSVNNNMGLRIEMTYRSSAQEWLDEKHEYEKLQRALSQSDAQPATPPVSHLPFPVQVLHQMVHWDEITPNRLVQQFSYRHGYYDGQAREFRGFGLVIHTDTELKEGDDAYTAPVQTKTWYHTGAPEDEKVRRLAYSQHDKKAIQLQTTIFTRFDADQNPQEVKLAETNLNVHRRMELFRALKGNVLREEVSGLDLPEAGPYTTRESRYLVRIVQEKGPNKHMVALPLLLETINCHYERTPTDPVCTQQVNLAWDRYGMPVHQVSVQYPRRHDAKEPIDELQAQWWKDTQDPSQEVLWLTQTRQSWYHLEQPDAWRLGLPHQSRQDAREITWVSSEIPTVSYEDLQDPEGFLNDSAYPPVLLGQQEIFYVGKDEGTSENPLLGNEAPLSYLEKRRSDNFTYPDVLVDQQGIFHEYVEEEIGQPILSGLIAYIESAELDEASLEAYEGIEKAPQGQVLFDELNLSNAGYLYKPAVLSSADEPELWWVRHDLCRYASEDQFQRLVQYESSPGINQISIEYDPYMCQAIAVSDAQSLRTEAEYDYRHLQPISIKDPNENIHEARYDGLSRLIATSFYDNSEDISPGLTLPSIDDRYPVPVAATTLAQTGQASADIAQGFAPLPSDYHHPISELDTALAQPEQAIGNIAAVYYYDTLSWKEKRVPVHSASLISDNYPQYASLADGSVLDIPELGSEHVAMVSPEDPLNWQERDSFHNANLNSDKDSREALVPQVRISIAWSDGFGRLLQTKQKVPPGLAYQRNEKGDLALEGSTPIETPANNRWVVSGRVEYNNKGLPIRTYHPYFVNSPLYINDASFRQFGYCEKHYYDPLGRKVRTVTAEGYLKRHTYCTWYEIEEDENDTLAETLAARQHGGTL
jgi:YD repeat-containing protein